MTGPFPFIVALFLAMMVSGCQAGAQTAGAVGQAIADTAEAAEAARVGAIQAVGQREIKTTRKITVNRLQPVGVVKRDSADASPPAAENTRRSGNSEI